MTTYTISGLQDRTEQNTAAPQLQHDMLRHSTVHQAHVVIGDPSAGVLLNDGMAIQLVHLSEVRAKNQSVCCPAVQLLLTNSTCTDTAPALAAVRPSTTCIPA
jgi:hypothetical protein